MTMIVIVTMTVTLHTSKLTNACRAMFNPMYARSKTATSMETMPVVMGPFGASGSGGSTVSSGYKLGALPWAPLWFVALAVAAFAASGMA
jgi:hypothetical protein